MLLCSMFCNLGFSSVLAGWCLVAPLLLGQQAQVGALLASLDSLALGMRLFAETCMCSTTGFVAHAHTARAAGRLRLAAHQRNLPQAC